MTDLPLKQGWTELHDPPPRTPPKTHGPPPPFGTKMTDLPLKQGWTELHDPPPSIKTWIFGSFLLIIQ